MRFSTPPLPTPPTVSPDVASRRAAARPTAPLAGPARPDSAATPLPPAALLVPAPPRSPAGHAWTLANARVADLLHHLVLAAGFAPPVVLDGQTPRLPEPAPAAAGSPAPLLIVNAAQFPLCDLRAAAEAFEAARGADACFFSLCQPRAGRPVYDEQLELGLDGLVRRVVRVYSAGGETRPGLGGGGDDDEDELGGGARWPSVIVLSAAAARRLAGVALPASPALWPAAFLQAGLRVHGLALEGRCFDLHDEERDLQPLAAALLRERPHLLAAAADLVELRPRVFAGRDVRIDPSAQVIGPVALGDQVTLGAGAVLVGPAVVGHGCTLEAGAIVRHATLAPGMRVRGAKAKDGVAAAAAAAAVEAAEAAEAAQVAQVESASPHGRSARPAHGGRTIRLQSVVETPGRSRPLAAGLRVKSYLVAKRVLDLVGALVFLALTLPLYPLIALAIKLNSPGGPVFYGHPRQGLGGRPFRCWKFRTMVPNAEQLKHLLAECNEVDGPQFKIRDDPRVFLVGRVLRRLNVDEWPQAFNVLLGEMSLVGPRPSPEHENQMCPAWREARLSVRPGITGLWQVSRQRDGETDFQEWIHYDVQYVKKRSFWLDLLILLRTVRVALRGS